MYAPKAVEMLQKVNTLSVDKEVAIIHHYVFTYPAHKRHTYNVDYVDHEDGSITGYLLGLDRNNYIISRENFKIDPDGKITQKGTFRNFALHWKLMKEEK